MSGFNWLPEFLSRLETEHVVLHQEADPQTLTPVHRMVLDNEDWGTVAKVAAAFGHRHAGVWGEHLDSFVVVRACLAFEGDYLVFETSVALEKPVLASHTPYFPGVNRLERHIQDMLGIAFLDHPDSRRWSRHQAWQEGRYPLRYDFPVQGDGVKRTPADSDYAFVPVLGNGVYQVPVGPVHAGIIEPGHFRFHAVGEQVLSLEQRLGYVHKGIEKIAEGRDAAGLARLAGRVSGDSTVAHAWAACMALERASGINVPPRALIIRAILAERERVANHLGDIGAICNDVGFAFAHMQCSRLREEWQRANKVVFGHRLLMDCIVPGGVASDLNNEMIEYIRTQIQFFLQTFNAFLRILDDQPSLDDRLDDTGILSAENAKQLGVLGYVGKASGVDYDVRRDHRYAPYDQFEISSPSETHGDVAARVQIRSSEILDSLNLLFKLLNAMPEGDVQASQTLQAVSGEGIGIVEGWRGEIISFVRLDDEGRVLRFFTRDPSWFSWPALEILIHGNIVADFPVCNKSVNGSYSGHDL